MLNKKDIKKKYLRLEQKRKNNSRQDISSDGVDRTISKDHTCTKSNIYKDVDEAGA
jgi:hypothetical protein